MNRFPLDSVQWHIVHNREGLGGNDNVKEQRRNECNLEEVETVIRKLHELTDEVLEQVTGGDLEKISMDDDPEGTMPQ